MIIFRNPLNTGLNEIKSFGKLNPFTKALNVKKDEFCYVSDLKPAEMFCERICDSTSWLETGWFHERKLAFAISKTHPEDVSTIENSIKKGTMV